MKKRDRQRWLARSPQHLLAEGLRQRLQGEAHLRQEEEDHPPHQLAVEFLDLHPVEVHRLLLEHPNPRFYNSPTQRLSRSPELLLHDHQLVQEALQAKVLPDHHQQEEAEAPQS